MCVITSILTVAFIIFFGMPCRHYINIFNQLVFKIVLIENQLHSYYLRNKASKYFYLNLLIDLDVKITK